MHLTRTIVWGSVGKACSCVQFIKKPYFLLPSHTRIRISTTSHTRICIRYILQVMCAVSERAMKSKFHIIMITSLSPKYQAIPEKISFICCCWDCCSCCALV